MRYCQMRLCSFIRNLVLCLAFAMGILLLEGRAFGDVVLVRDGVPNAVIVLGEHPTRSAQMGAFELNHHIRMMTGAELPVQAHPMPGKPGIYISGDPRVTGGLDGESLHLFFKDGNIHLHGGDAQDFGKVDYVDYKSFPPNNEHYKGSLWAVYEFLEICCGFRFYWIDDSGTTYKPKKTLAVKETERRLTPAMDAFRYSYLDKPAPQLKPSPREQALWRLRWRMSSNYGQTNHNMASIYFRYYKRPKDKYLAPLFIESRPEYFAQGRDGNCGDWLLNRAFPGDNQVPPQLCYTHPDVIAFYAKEVLAYARGGNVKGGWGNKVGTLPENVPVIHRLSGKPFFYPLEGADNGSFCLCKNCRKWYRRDGSISDLKFHFLGEIARKVAEVDPQAGVSTLAYIQCLDYPEKAELPPNLSVQLCLTNYCWWHPVAYKLQHGVYKRWVEREAKRRVLTLWTYLFGPAWDSIHFGKYKFFPGVYPHATGRMFREFLEDGIRGWFTEVQMQYNGLEAYIACRMCYDSSADPERIIDEYFRDSFGEAAPYVRTFYEELERAYWNPENCPEEWLRDESVFMGPAGKKHPYWGTGLHSPDINWALGTRERMAKLAECISQARSHVRTPQEKVRLQHLVDFLWTPTLEGRKERDELEALPKVVSDVTVPMVNEASGDLKAVAWEKAYQTGFFNDALGRPTLKKCRMWFGRDSRWLYLKLEENAPQRRGVMMWRDNLEIFFARSKTYPLLQLAVSPAGESAQYQYTLVNDFPRNAPTETKMRFLTEQTDNRWEIRMAIPLEALPVDESGAVTANFFRTWGAHGEFASWTPSLQSNYIAGLPLFGVLRMK